MFTRDIERLVRMFIAQKLDPDYIRHYLQESYQLDQRTIDEVFARLGVGPRPDRKGGPAKKDDAKVNKQKFF